MKKFLILPLLLIGVALSAQHQGHCGTTFEDQQQWRDRLAANVEFARQMKLQHGVDDRSIAWVPVHFHLVGASDGTGKSKMYRALDALCVMNEQYLPYEIQFYLSPHPTQGMFDVSINNDNVYNEQSAIFAMNLKRHQNAVNIYIVAKCDYGNTDDGVLAYYSPSQDYIVIEKPYLTDINTLSHETGHFLSLQHPFYGWEGGCFNSSYATWPVAPVNDPMGGPTELQDGSNGTVAADMIADTPPDYNFGYCQAGCATYNGGAKDPTGVIVNPQENNFMGYFFSCSSYQFTTDQVDAMYADLQSSQRNYLDNNYSPSCDLPTTPNNLLISPINNVGDIPGANATLLWHSVPCATHYLVEVDITPSFSSSLGAEYIVTDTTKTINGLMSDRKYYWRVRPFSQNYVCAVAKSSSFETLNSNDITEVSDWTLQPNPAAASDQVILRVQSTGSVEASLIIADAAGRTVYSRGDLQFNAGEQQMTLPTQQLPQGAYFVRLQNKQGVEVKKLMILR